MVFYHNIKNNFLQKWSEIWLSNFKNPVTTHFFDFPKEKCSNYIFSIFQRKNVVTTFFFSFPKEKRSEYIFFFNFLNEKRRNLWFRSYGQYNPNTFVDLVGKVKKKNSPEGGRDEEKARAVRPGLEPGTCCVLGEGPQLHARGADQTSK